MKFVCPKWQPFILWVRSILDDGKLCPFVFFGSATGQFLDANVIPSTMHLGKESMGSAFRVNYSHLKCLWRKFLLDSLQLFPLFAFAPFINIPFILFDTESLKIGSYRKLTIDRDGDVEKNHSSKEGDRREITLSVANLHEDINLNNLGYTAGQDDLQTNMRRQKHSLKYAWFCLKTFYTAPCNKFLFNLVSLVNLNHQNYWVLINLLKAI